MTLNVAIQMDPIESIDINADGTFRIVREAQERGHRLFYYLPEDLVLEDGRLLAKGCDLTVRQVESDHFSKSEALWKDLSEADVVWLRQDPPFDMSYVTTTHLLETIMRDTLVVNDPFWVRNYPEKLIVWKFPEIIPPTVIARNLESLSAFRAKHGDIIVKPLYGNGGAGVFFVKNDDMNFNALCEMFLASNREPVILQKFLPDVRSGDKRVILVDGDPVGAINRVPAANEARSNLHVGGIAEAASLTARDREICAAVGPVLKDAGQIFAGIDIIGGYLTEVNITSPTGIVELERFTGINSAGLIWDAIEAKLADR